MNTGTRIKEARLAAGLTQKELAYRVGVKFSAIHKYESGMVVNLKRETLSALAQALGVRESWLLCLEEREERPARDIDPIYEALNDSGRKELCRYGRYLTGFAEYQAQDHLDPPLSGASGGGLRLAHRGGGLRGDPPARGGPGGR